MGDLEGDDVLALHRLADDDQLGDVGMGGGDLFELLLEATWSAVRAEDRVARSGEARRHLCRRLAVDLLELEVDALVGEVVGLLAADHDLDVELTAGRRHGRDVARVDAGGAQRLELAQVERADVDVEAVVARLLAGGCGASGRDPQTTHQHANGHDGRDPAPHLDTPRLIRPP